MVLTTRNNSSKGFMRHKMNKKEQTYQRIKENIIYGRYSPGERLLETNLTNELNSSRLYVREALRRLHDEGLLTITPNKGATVKKLSLDEAVQCYGILANLESYAAELAIPYLTKTQCKNFERINNKLINHIEEKNFFRYIRENLTFHLFLPKLSKNDILVDLIINLRNRNLMYSYYVFIIPGYVEEYLKQHEMIVKACYDKDISLIKECIKDHIHCVRDNLISNFKKM